MNKWLGFISKNKNEQKEYDLINVKHIIDLNFNEKWNELKISKWGTDHLGKPNIETTTVTIFTPVFYKIIKFLCDDKHQYYLIGLDGDDDLLG